MNSSHPTDAASDSGPTSSSAGTVAIVLADDFEDSEFTEPRDALTDAGYRVEIIGIEPGSVTGKNGTEVTIDLPVSSADPARYSGLLIPGGFSPDRLRTDDEIVALVNDLVTRPAPTGAICHAPSLLIEAGTVEGRRLTSFQSIRTDLVNAGAEVVDEEVVIDDKLITSRHPGDLPAFIDALLGALRSEAALTRGLSNEPAVTEQPSSS